MEELRKSRGSSVAALTGGADGRTGSLSCGSEMAPDRVISHAAVYPDTLPRWKGESPPPPRPPLHEYLFGGGSVSGLRRGMKNGGQLSIFRPIGSLPASSTCDSSDQ